jgi:hypothetical protein
LGLPFWFRHYRCGMVAADVVEAAENIIITSNDENRLASNSAGDVLSRLTNLVGTINQLPGTGKDRALF